MSGGFILLEGPDAAGKTTLAEAIKNHLGEDKCEVLHAGPPSKNIWNEHLNLLHTAAGLLRQKKVVVFDRHFVSESVYGRVFRNGAAYKALMRHVDRVFNRFYAIKVLCLPKKQVLIDNFNKIKATRTELYESMDKVYALYEQFGFGFEEGSVEDVPADYCSQIASLGGALEIQKNDWMHYDFSINELEAYAERVVARLEAKSVEQDKDMVAMALSPGANWFTGRWDAPICLLGNTPNPGIKLARWPFTANRGGSVFLADALHHEEIDESFIKMININEALVDAPDNAYSYGVQQLKRILETSKCIISMGSPAERAVRSLGFAPNIAMVHPSYALRFQHSTADYGRIISEAISQVNINPKLRKK